MNCAKLVNGRCRHKLASVDGRSLPPALLQASWLLLATKNRLPDFAKKSVVRTLYCDSPACYNQCVTSSNALRQTAATFSIPVKLSLTQALMAFIQKFLVNKLSSLLDALEIINNFLAEEAG